MSTANLPTISLNPFFIQHHEVNLDDHLSTSKGPAKPANTGLQIPTKTEFDDVSVDSAHSVGSSLTQELLSRFNGDADTPVEAEDREKTLKNTSKVVASLWERVEIAEMLFLLRGVFPVSAEEVTKHGWDLLLTGNLREATIKAFFEISKSQKYCPVQIPKTLVANPIIESDLLRYFMSMMIRPYVQYRLRHLVRDLRASALTQVTTHPTFSELQKHSFKYSLREKILKQYKYSGTGIHRPGIDTYTGLSCSYFTADPLIQVTSAMLARYTKAQLREGLKFFNVEHLPIETLIVPTVFLESEIDFQEGDGRGRSFPKEATSNLLVSEHSSIDVRHKQFDIFKAEREQNMYFFSVQIQVLYPLRLQILGPPKLVVPQLAFIPLQPFEEDNLTVSMHQLQKAPSRSIHSSFEDDMIQLGLRSQPLGSKSELRVQYTAAEGASTKSQGVPSTATSKLNTQDSDSMAVVRERLKYQTHKAISQGIQVLTTALGGTYKPQPLHGSSLLFSSAFPKPEIPQRFYNPQDLNMLSIRKVDDDLPSSWTENLTLHARISLKSPFQLPKRSSSRSPDPLKNFPLGLRFPSPPFSDINPSTTPSESAGTDLLFSPQIALSTAPPLQCEASLEVSKAESQPDSDSQLDVISSHFEPEEESRCPVGDGRSVIIERSAIETEEDYCKTIDIRDSLSLDASTIEAEMATYLNKFHIRYQKLSQLHISIDKANRVANLIRSHSCTKDYEINFFLLEFSRSNHPHASQLTRRCKLQERLKQNRIFLERTADARGAVRRFINDPSSLIEGRLRFRCPSCTQKHTL